MTNQPEDESAILATYQSYLIRLWKDSAEGLWRASAQSIPAGAVVRFTNLTAMFAYLEAQTTEAQQDTNHRLTGADL